MEYSPQTPENSNEFSEDLEPAPRPIQAWGPGDDVPRPLLRQTMTIVPPWDNGSDVTLQVIVLAEAADDADVTARRGDVPELAEAGWSRVSMKGLEVCVRVVG